MKIDVKYFVIFLLIFGFAFALPPIAPISELTSPTNGTDFSQCFLPVVVNITFDSGTTVRSINCKLYYAGQFFDYEYLDLNTSGSYTLNFTTPIQNGNYSVICDAQDSAGTSTTSAYTRFYDMLPCYTAHYGTSVKNSSTTGGGIYEELNALSGGIFDFQNVLGIAILGLAMFGMVSYATRLRKGKKVI